MIHKYQNQIKNKKFLTVHNEFQYNPPFLIFYNKINTEELKKEDKQKQMTISNFHEHLMIPHQYELMKFFENFHMMKYPKEPILMLKRKCKYLMIS